MGFHKEHGTLLKTRNPEESLIIARAKLTRLSDRNGHS